MKSHFDLFKSGDINTETGDVAYSAVNLLKWPLKSY